MTKDINKDLEKIKARISDSDFLNNKGLSNEVGIHVFCYDPKDELIVRDYIQWLKSHQNEPYHIIECDLYEVFLSLLEEKRVLKAVDGLEEKKGKDFLLEQLQKIATPEAIVKKINYPSHQKGKDVLFLTGVGKVNPFIRSHMILDNIQQYFEDIPIVLFYPGTFDGQKLSLFGKFLDGNYYRAFNLI